MKDYFFELRRKIQRLQLPYVHSFKGSCENMQSLKNSDLNVIQTHDHYGTGAVLYQRSY